MLGQYQQSYRYNKMDTSDIDGSKPMSKIAALHSRMSRPYKPNVNQNFVVPSARQLRMGNAGYNLITGVNTATPRAQPQSEMQPRQPSVAELEQIYGNA